MRVDLESGLFIYILKSLESKRESLDVVSSLQSSRMHLSLSLSHILFFSRIWGLLKALWAVTGTELPFLKVAGETETEKRSTQSFVPWVPPHQCAELL